MAMRHRHSVLPRTLTKLVEMRPMPKPSDSPVTTSVKSASTARKIRTDGLRAMNDLFIGSIPRRTAFEGDDAPWPELNENNDKDDHIGLRRQRV